MSGRDVTVDMSSPCTRRAREGECNTLRQAREEKPVARDTQRARA
jgi:hypothetical protein